MRVVQIMAAACLLMLAACGAPPRSAAPVEEPAAEAPAPPPPAADAPSEQAPEDEESATRDEPRDRVIVPALVELLPSQPRLARQGGASAVLLADPALPRSAGKNLVLCEHLFRGFEQATGREIAVGARIGAEGEIERLRPIYWLTRRVSEGRPGAEACPTRLETYDYPRSGRIARKLGLANPGPYLVIERDDPFETERVAAVIDLSRTPQTQIGAAVVYFRDGFMQASDAWAPQTFAPTRARDDIIAFAGPGTYNFLPQLLRATRQAGCPLTNLLDLCEAPN